MTTALTSVLIEAADIARGMKVFGAICGVEAVLDASAEGGQIAQFLLDDAVLAVSSAKAALPGARTRAGLRCVTIAVPDVAEREQSLLARGVALERIAGALTVPARYANGIDVALVPGPAVRAAGPAAGARLDHVALRVRDLDEACAMWRCITGVEARQMGIHPVSRGAFTAARLPLGERMIELICPVRDVDSEVAKRLVSHGEGVAALALPVTDHDAAIVRLNAVGVQAIWRDPHWFVRPSDACGVLVQLTPRIEHD